MEGIVTHTHRFSALRIAPACPHFRHLRRMQMAKSPLRKTTGIQTAGNQRQFATHRKNKTTKCLSDHRICPPTLLPQQAKSLHFRNKRFTHPGRNQQGSGYRQRTPALGFHVPGLFDKVVDIE